MDTTSIFSGDGRAVNGDKHHTGNGNAVGCSSAPGKPVDLDEHAPPSADI